MASSPVVFEVMIYCVEADADAAAHLQHHLHRDGIRAGLTQLNSITKNPECSLSKHSICFIGAGFDHHSLSNIPTDLFDFVFVAPASPVRSFSGNVILTYTSLV